VLRVLEPGARLHTAGTLLDGYDVDGLFDSFRADHADRWATAGLAEVAPDGCYPTTQVGAARAGLSLSYWWLARSLSLELSGR
jgi:hypothetical protein